MTSGRKLTEEEADAILRLAGRKDQDGQWSLSYVQIAEQLGIHRRTVWRQIRRAAVLWGERSAWKAGDPI